MRNPLFRILISFIVLFGANILVESISGQKRAAVPQQRESHRVILNPCRIPKVEGEVRCGTYEVFENREARKGRRIALKIVVLPALNPQLVPDALFILAGVPVRRQQTMLNSSQALLRMPAAGVTLCWWINAVPEARIR